MPTPDEILSARKCLGLTQPEAAALIGVTKITWLRWENGHTALPEHTWAHWKHVAGLEKIPFSPK